MAPQPPVEQSAEPQLIGPVLVTNDDGIDSAGLAVLARTLERAGHEVIVAAPSTDMSGAAAAIGPVDPTVPMRRTALEGVTGACFAVDSPPAMIVIAGMSGAFGATPVAVVSGINAGVNLGRAILHSGTVGAALTAQNLGHPAVAVSLQTGGDRTVAAAMAAAVLADLLRRTPPLMANLNVPSGATHDTEIVATRLARFGSVTAAIVGDSLDFQLVIDPEHFDEEGSDGAVVRSGRASVTLLGGFGADVEESLPFSLRRVRVEG